jgi:hypothetical protein
MTIQYIPLESKSGFKSPGFYVDETGRVFVSELTIAPENGLSILQADEVYIRGVQLLEGIGDGSSLIALGNNILASSLTQLGTQEYLYVDGDVSFAQGANTYISVVNGLVEIDSVSATGRIDNITVGLTDPAASKFTNTTITGTATVQGASVLNTVTATGISSSGNIQVGILPTSANHVTRKDYVDNRISAFSIAFGA